MRTGAYIFATGNVHRLLSESADSRKIPKNVPPCEKRGSYPRQHKIIELASLCSELKTDLDSIKDECASLSSLMSSIFRPAILTRCLVDCPAAERRQCREGARHGTILSTRISP